VKESDRLSAIAYGLKACGLTVSEMEDSLSVEGRGANVTGGARVKTHLDHRIAMSFLCMGLAARDPRLSGRHDDDRDELPEFEGLMRGLGAELRGAKRMSKVLGRSPLYFPFSWCRAFLLQKPLDRSDAVCNIKIGPPLPGPKAKKLQKEAANSLMKSRHLRLDLRAGRWCEDSCSRLDVVKETEMNCCCSAKARVLAP